MIYIFYISVDNYYIKLKAFFGQIHEFVSTMPFVMIVKANQMLTPSKFIC